MCAFQVQAPITVLMISALIVCGCTVSSAEPCFSIKSSQDNVVVLTTVSEDYIEVLRLWVQSVKAVGIKKFAVVALDPAALKAAESFAPGHVAAGFDKKNPPQPVGSAAAQYGNERYLEGLRHKARVIWSALGRNRTVLFSDVDMLFIRNPLEYLDSHTVSLALTYGKDNARGDEAPSNFNAGFIYVKPTPQAKAIIQTWKGMCKEIWKYESPFDQLALNIVLRATNTTFPHLVELPTRLFQTAPDCKAVPAKCKSPYVVHFLGYPTPAGKAKAMQVFDRGMSRPVYSKE
eukprot:m.73168 g.73168  ORF g.73168 m.73168 type:complete len:290 (+) comp12360_c0_seq2:126-995(+)